MSKIDFERYEKFVDAVTSDASTDFVALSDRLVELDEKVQTLNVFLLPVLVSMPKVESSLRL